METLGNKIDDKSTATFYCEICDYITCHKGHYNEHLTSLKHCKRTKMETMETKIDDNNEIINNEEAVKCTFEYLKSFPIDDYIPNRIFQKHRPTDDALYQDLKEYNRAVEINFLEFFVKSRQNFGGNYKIATKNLWKSFEELNASSISRSVTAGI